MDVASEVQESAYAVRSLTQPQAAVIRADFLAYNQRNNDARALLEQAMRDDPANSQARETMGFLESMQGHKTEARKWYEEAVKLDSQNYMAHYYFASLAMNGDLSAAEEATVEASLRAAIKLNPSFAPAYDRLASFYGSRRKNLQEAYELGTKAVQNDPSNIWFRLNLANILMASERVNDALGLLQNAAVIAKDDGERSSVQSMVATVESYKK